MNTISVSYNFPTGFLWGITPPDEVLSDAANSSFFFDIKEKGIKSILLEIQWARCEPLKEQFDETYIESRRSLLARIKSRNIEPVVILDSRELPAWKNLDHPKQNGNKSDETFSFYSHLAEALVPYTNYFGFYCGKQGLFNRNEIKQLMLEYRQISDRIHTLSDSANSGLILPQDFGLKNRSEFNDLLGRNKYHYLQTEEIDFLGVPFHKYSSAGLLSVLGDHRIPLLFTSDNLRGVSADDRLEVMTDTLYDIWKLYQKGMPILGYYSETDLLPDKPETELYENTCKYNALILSTDMQFLPEKWHKFLKD